MMMNDFIYHTVMLICCVLIAIFSLLMLFDAIEANAAEYRLPNGGAVVTLPMKAVLDVDCERQDKKGWGTPIEKVCKEMNECCAYVRAKQDPVTEVEFEQPWDIEPAARGDDE